MIITTTSDWVLLSPKGNISKWFGREEVEPSRGAVCGLGITFTILCSVG